jgi:hypothetical protein
MDSPLARRSLASALVVLAVVLGALLLWPKSGPSPAEPVRAAPKPRPVAQAQVAEGPPATSGEQRAVRVELDDLPKNASPNCRQVVTWHRRNVPGWVIEDNMSAQAMLFSEEEMACLEGAGVSDQILDWAQWNQRKPQGPERNDPLLPPDE